MPSHTHYAPRRFWFEDRAIGHGGISASRTVTEADVATFAGRTHDHAELHTSDSYAADTAFGGRISHGMLNLSLAHGLVVNTGYFQGTSVALLGWSGIRFTAPVDLGDTVHATWETTDLRASTSRPDVGIASDLIRLIRADGTVAVQGTVTEMVRRRLG